MTAERYLPVESGRCPAGPGVDSLSRRCDWGDHDGMRRGILAPVVTAVALLLAVVAVGGTLLVGLDASSAVSSYLISNLAIGLSATPGGYLIARKRPSAPRSLRIGLRSCGF